MSLPRGGETPALALYGPLRGTDDSWSAACRKPAHASDDQLTRRRMERRGEERWRHRVATEEPRLTGSAPAGASGGRAQRPAARKERPSHPSGALRATAVEEHLL